ncbi:MAG: ribonuclease Z [Gemmatimonadaceae bacterium]|nr:ribonuclease Z [Gemmatimonadaceae bacterium]
MRLTTVGTGTISLWPGRGCASHLVEAGDVRLLLDCGPGTAVNMARLGLDWWGVTHVALTHFHLDHIGDLPALVFAWRHARREPRNAPLVLLGPVGTAALLERWGAALGDWLTIPGFPLTIVEVPLEMPVALADDVHLTARHVPHTDESVAYSVEHDGRRLVYTGDTGVDESLGAWAAGCDLLLAECSLPDAMAIPTHLTPAQCGALAAAAQPARLVVTHMYPPLEGMDLRAEIGAHWAGEVVVARDALRLDC